MDVSVFGFWIGQSRKDAFAAARNHSGELWDQTGAMVQRLGACRTPSCRLLILQANAGATLDFDAADALSGIRIESDFGSRQAVDPARQIKGALGELLRNYSDALRLKVLGTPERTVDDPPVDDNFVTYYYDTRGLSIRLQRATDHKGPYGPPLIFLCLYRPNGAPCKQW